MQSLSGRLAFWGLLRPSIQLSHKVYGFVYGSVFAGADRPKRDRHHHAVVLNEKRI